MSPNIVFLNLKVYVIGREEEGEGEGDRGGGGGMEEGEGEGGEKTKPPGKETYAL